MSFVSMFPVYVNFTLHVNSQHLLSTWLAKNKELYVSALNVGVIMTQLMYGWYSDSSVLLEDPGIYLGPGV